MPEPKTRKSRRLEAGMTIGRVCPVITQQCRLARGCVLFNDAVTDHHPADDKLRASACEKRGAFIFPDELKARRFDTKRYVDARRFTADRGRRLQLAGVIRRRDQLSLLRDGASAADAAKQIVR